MKKSVEGKLFKKFTWRYIIALSIIAILTIASQWRIQQHLSRSLDDSHVINFTARLRTHSQTLSKTALMLQNDYDYESSKKEFLNTLRQWEKVQKSLEDGNKFLELPTYNLGEIKELFELVRHPREEMMLAAEHIIAIIDTSTSANSSLLRPYVETILNNEQSYLLGMDLIVFEYDRFARERISRLKDTDYIMCGILLLTITLEVLFIFYPLSMYIKRVVVGLVRSEKRIINGQEKERKRIAAEIHDGIGQMLTSLRMKLEQLADEKNDKSKDMLVVNSMLHKLIIETRRICADLLPSVLEDFGLLSAIEDLIKTCKDTDRSISFVLDSNLGQKVLSPELEVTLYRIIQESLNNIIKHADATLVEIYIDTSQDFLNLIVKDNGRGFYFEEKFLHDPKKTRKMNGLKGMKERAELLRGIFILDTEPGKGTTVVIEIPY